MKWCWFHAAWEPMGDFGKSKGRSDGLQPLCRQARAEQDRAKRASRAGYKPQTPQSVREAAPEGKKWCAAHGHYCNVTEFGRDERKKGSLQSSCRGGARDLDAARVGRSSRASKYNPPPAGTKWCCWHKRHEPRECFADASVTAKDKSGKVSMCRVGQTEYYRANKGRYLGAVRLRQARKLRATPKWADVQAMSRIYAECRQVERATGVPHNVDHAVPLKNRYVCGLHIPCNLRVITAAENSSKNNKLIPSLAIDLTAPGWAHLHPQAA